MIKFYINTTKEEVEHRKMICDSLDLMKKNNIVFTYNEKYDRNKLEKWKNEIKVAWEKQKDDFEEKLKYFFRIKNKAYKVKIAGCGSLGAYDTETNAVILNGELFKRYGIDFVVKTIKHEIIHLILEPFVEKFKLDHSKKEELIDSVEKLIK